jgi:NTP pyrophosphatase (non-canonical NTP hydrolase)
MDFNEYQNEASTTATYPGVNGLPGISYCTLGLTGEAGEVANKVKKILRGDKTIEDAGLDIVSELGDCLWYLSELAKNLGVSLESVAIQNIQKLQSRRERGVIKGSGDDR